MLQGNGPQRIGTDWQAVWVAAALPLVAAVLLVRASLQPLWGEDSGEWAAGLLLLIPLEFLRALNASFLSDTYREYRAPRQAMADYLLKIGILAGLALPVLVFKVGISGLVALFVSDGLWQWVLLPLVMLLGDSLLALYFFREGTAARAARLDALADDTADLLQLTVWMLPIVAAVTFGLYLLKDHDHSFARWLPAFDSEVARSLAMLLAAGYFLARAVIAAYLETASFARSGRRLLGARWMQWLQSRDSEQFGEDVRGEERKRRRRCEALAEEGCAASGDAGRVEDLRQR